VDSFRVKPFHIVSIGRLEPEKGHAVLIDALANLNKINPGFTAKIIGPGSERKNLQNYIKQSGLSAKIEVCGVISWGKELFENLDESHLFVLPSFTEGMPRALLEAMARGLPAIGSDVGGIKELLPAQYRTAPGDASLLAKKIAEVMADFSRLEEMSQTNFRKAMEYRPEIINQRKRDFWQCIKEHSC